jgi:hypothetical protein
MAGEAAGDFPRAYGAGLWARALCILVGVPLLAGGALLALTLLRGHQLAAPWLSLVVFGVALLGLYVIVGAWRYRLTLTADAIEVRGALRTRRMARADIAGRRLLTVQYGQKLLVLCPRAPGAKELKISRTGLRTDAAFDSWIASLPDLDADEARGFEAQVAADAELGQTPGERLERLAAARKVAQGANAAAYALFFWGWFYPRPYALPLLAAALLPWAAIGLTAKSGGLYRLDTRRNDPRPHLGSAVLLPGFMLLIRAMTDIGVLDYPRALTYAAVAALLLTWAAFMSDAGLRARPASALLLLGMVCPYGYGVTVLGDSQLDYRPARDYRVEVLTRHVSRGSRSTTYHLLLDRWGPRPDPNDVTVPREVYLVAEPGSFVCVHQGPGLLDVPWFVVNLCAGAGDPQRVTRLVRTHGRACG